MALLGFGEKMTRYVPSLQMHSRVSCAANLNPSATQLGRLNLLTPKRKAAAAKLIEHGDTINLE